MTDNVAPPRLGKRAVLAILRAYQSARAGSVSPCRFYPSCSAYAVEAVERHGAWRGSLLAARRLSRCHPLGGHGVDLVPDETRAAGTRPSDRQVDGPEPGASRQVEPSGSSR